MSYVLFVVVFFFKQKTAYEMRISDWSSDVCSSDLRTCGSALSRRSTSSVLAVWRIRRFAVQGFGERRWECLGHPPTDLNWWITNRNWRVRGHSLFLAGHPTALEFGPCSVQRVERLNIVAPLTQIGRAHV